jgi:hypothetical protein
MVGLKNVDIQNEISHLERKLNDLDLEREQIAQHLVSLKKELTVSLSEKQSAQEKAFKGQFRHLPRPSRRYPSSWICFGEFSGTFFAKG